jgi:hypothetical protein
MREQTMNCEEIAAFLASLKWQLLCSSRGAVSGINYSRPKLTLRHGGLQPP